MRPFRFLPLLLPLLAACEAKKPDWAKESAPGTALPAQICAQVKKGLDAMTKGGFEYDDKGGATLPVAAWTAMAPTQRDQLATTLAYQAACASGETSEAQSVVIRGDDGSELLRRTLSTRVDAGELLGEEG